MLTRQQILDTRLIALVWVNGAFYFYAAIPVVAYHLCAYAYLYHLSIILYYTYHSINSLSTFQQVVNWAVSSCKTSNVVVSPENLRAVLGINFHSIRFTTISRDDFFSVVGMRKINYFYFMQVYIFSVAVPTRILTDEEVENMLMIIDEEQTAIAGPSDHQEEQQDIGAFLPQVHLKSQLQNFFRTSCGTIKSATTENWYNSMGRKYSNKILSI